MEHSHGAVPQSSAGTAPDDAKAAVLSTNEAWSLVRRAVVGRLAVVVDGRPEIFPVNHVVDHGSVVFRTGAGTKLASGAGAAVAFECDGYDAATSSAWSVVVKGTGSEIRATEEVLDALNLPLVPWHAAPKPRFVRIEPETVTGRRFVVDDAIYTR